MSKRLFCVGLVLIALCAISAHAVPLTWTLQGVTFADGSTASGTFVYDADNPVPNGTYSNISITTTAGTTVLASGFPYISPNQVSYELRLFPVTTTNPDLTGTPSLWFRFALPLGDAGGTSPLILTGPQQSFWGVCNDPQCYSVVIPSYVAVTAGAVTATPAVANTTYFTTYYSSNVANAPDETLRIINDGADGPLFASIYVFDDSEELTQCCSCRVTPDGLLSESVKLNLTANPLRNIVNSRGVIKVISSSTESDVNTNFAANTPVLGLRVWMTHIQGTKVTLSPGNAVVPTIASPYFVTETEGAPSNLSAGEQMLLQNLCMFDNLLSGKPCTCQPEDYDF
ncbi:MAG: hypothetical protein WB566_03850 [Terriglobales bacterium]